MRKLTITILAITFSACAEIKYKGDPAEIAKEKAACLKQVTRKSIYTGSLERTNAFYHEPVVINTIAECMSIKGYHWE